MGDAMGDAPPQTSLGPAAHGHIETNQFIEDSPPSKVWVAYHADWSSLAIFDFNDELGALRYAVENHMEVDLVPTGVSVHEHIETTLRRQALEARRAREGAAS